MFVLGARIKIGDKRFAGHSGVVVKRSIFNLSATCTIKLPYSSRIHDKEGKVSLVDTAKQFKRGDYATVEIAYNDRFYKEFAGYVSRVNLTRPVEIELEGHGFMLREVNIHKVWKSTTIKDILSYVNSEVKKQKGYEIKLAKDMPDVKVLNYGASNKTAMYVLNELKDKYGLAMFFDFDGTLFCGLLYQRQTGRVKYNFQKNVVSPNDLKWQDAEDIRVKISAVSYDINGKRILAKIGTDNIKSDKPGNDESGEIRTLYLYDIKTEKELEARAKAELAKYKYTGYRGSIEGFLEPYCEPCMAVELKDPDYGERDGTFYCESTELKVDRGGARRRAHLGIKLSV